MPARRISQKVIFLIWSLFKLAESLQTVVQKPLGSSWALGMLSQMLDGNSLPAARTIENEKWQMNVSYLIDRQY
jgi:hypothetical protein